MCKFFRITNAWFMQCSPSQILLTSCVFIEHKYYEYELQQAVLAKWQALHLLACYGLQQGSSLPIYWLSKQTSQLQAYQGFLRTIFSMHLNSSTCHILCSCEGTCILSHYSDLSHQMFWVEFVYILQQGFIKGNNVLTWCPTSGFLSSRHTHPSCKAFQDLSIVANSAS